MRPLKLTMQAFGPYAHKEVIDFTVLGNRTMFVISGKTGSGKTTIFDGISYAIYGKASGEDRNGQELRSQFADDSLLTEVSFEFKLKEKRYLIIRSPQQEKKKERGDGFTTIGAKAELFTFDEDGKELLVASSVRDVDEKVKEIMQIDSNQFRQILMIPQGEFRRLLTSDSKEKENILQRLFHTEMYKRIEERLKEQAQGLKKEVEQKTLLRNNALTKIAAVFHKDLIALIEQGSDNDVAILPLLEQEIELMDEEIKKLQTKLEHKNKERDVIRQHLYEAESILKQMKLKEDLSARLKELESQKKDYTETETKIDLAQKAALLAQQEEICHHLKRQIDDSKAEEKLLRSTLETIQAQLIEAEQQYKEEVEKEEERKQLANYLVELKNMEKDVLQYAEVEGELLQLKQSMETHASQQETLQKQRKEKEITIQTYKERIKQLDGMKEMLLENKDKIRNLQSILERINDYMEVTDTSMKRKADAKTKKQMLDNVVKRLEDAKALVENLENKWITNQSVMLATSLKTDEACPVCGSVHHPDPATNLFHDDDFSEEDRKSAKKDLEMIEKEKTIAETAWLEANTQWKWLAEDAQNKLKKVIDIYPSFTEEDCSVVANTIQSQLQELSLEQKKLAMQTAEMEKIKQSLTDVEVQLQEVHAQLDKIAEGMAKTSIAYTEQNTTLKKMKETIPSDLRELSKYKKVWQESSLRLEKMEARFKFAQEKLQSTKEKWQKESVRLESLEKQIKQLSDNLQAEREIFLDRMAKQGFPTYRAYAESKLQDQEVEKLKAAVQAYREECRSVSDRLQDLEEALKDITVPNMEELQKQLSLIVEEASRFQQEHTNMLIKQKDNKEIQHQVVEINKKVKELENQFKLVGHLYDISRGQNSQRITFERYVLASFLDEILLQANSRLKKMTSGRYKLVRKSDRSKGNVQSGLELLVFDQYTGQERHVKTLSGGESFKAALSLALGLSDVVQNFAGGISLETMFIDEGFGTLDPESLDQAIETLMDIQNSGRLVGVISHVPELKDRMEVRLEVIAGQTGSTTRFEYIQ
ncbi:AAA family ATPase [Niallia sp. FSL W8-0635]|uniref:AAA family ATPase n=1 Tax=Niallia sp. FSL W8-0635 TaxID=2975337 RepID=UPI0009D095CB|nr:chromosome partition ATPase protein [Mycobacteroides abscessus subsp. abscessus]HEO8418369.1 SMC family ATPase [Yersinia enterocolitica]